MAKDSENTTKEESQPEKSGINRRQLLQMGVATGVTAAAAMTVGKAPTAKASEEGNSIHVGPGELDEYYGFWSGGQSGEVRLLGLPSMRELKRIPVFNQDCTYGHGFTNYTKDMLKGKVSGDTHHLHLSYKDGTYDGKYGFVNDKAQARLARIRLDYMECDKIIDIPNCQGTHGI
ncbi:MAG: TAT-dependent nitrous-oxide reductase, partial [Deltaproteobacteria bacterium]|nr:TAT-dependent nitrous-oxide reductase [Deltaproteobacteria bacterium]